MLTIARILFGFVPPLLLGVFVARVLAPPLPTRSRGSFTVSLGIFVGLGLASLTYFLWLICFGPPGAAYVIAESSAMIACAVLLSLVERRRAPLSSVVRELPASASEAPRMLRAAFIAASALALAGYGIVSICLPHGWWDAWMNWNLRARFLFRDADHWRGAFSPLLGYSHPHYPVLLPSDVARSWVYARRDTLLVPGLIGFLFTFGTVALLVTAVSAFRTRTLGLSAGLVLLGSLFFIKHGASQTADVPLGFFLLSSLTAFAWSDRAGGAHAGGLFLAGLAGGFAAWTKDEGLLVLAALSCMRAVVVLRREGARRLAREMLWVVAGAAPVLVLIAYFKLAIAPPTSLQERLDALRIMEHICDHTKYVRIAKGLVRGLLRLGNGFPLLLLVTAFLLRTRPEDWKKSTLLTGWLSLAVVLAGWLVVFLLGSADLSWILATSMDRLLLQVWPSAIFLLFLTLRSPEEPTADSRE